MDLLARVQLFQACTWGPALCAWTPSASPILLPRCGAQLTLAILPLQEGLCHNSALQVREEAGRAVGPGGAAPHLRCV